MPIVQVSALDAELEFDINTKTKSSEVFRCVNQALGIAETWYFGLMYYNENNIKIWCESSKKTVKELLSNATKLKYRVKYYPENIQELIEDKTVKYFYLQVRLAILSDLIYCPPDVCILLASYAAQIRHGDFNPNKHQNGFFDKEIILPERLFEQHRLNRGDWENYIMKLWQKHSGMSAEDAMVEFLKLAQSLEMYGISYFDIYNKKGTHAVLGVDILGLNVYIKGDVLTPIVSFPWSEINTVVFTDKKIRIQFIDHKAREFIFFADDLIINKNILKLVMGNHMLYIKKQGPEPLIEQVMKANVAEKRKERLELRAKLLEEATAREQAEKLQEQHHQRARLLEDKIINQNNLMEAQSTMHKLQEQLNELQLAKDSHERKQKELQETECMLEQSKHLEAEKQNQLEREIAIKQAEVRCIQNEVQRKDKEMEKLQMVIEEAKQRELQLKKEQELLLNDLSKPQELQGASSALPLLVQVNDRFKSELKILREVLEQTRDISKETTLDQIYRQHQQEGKDKYRTLDETRKGNMIQRVKLFDKM